MENLDLTNGNLPTTLSLRYHSAVGEEIPHLQVWTWNKSIGFPWDEVDDMIDWLLEAREERASMNSNITVGRGYADPTDLMNWAQEEVELRVNANQTFNAYEVTQAIRGLHPGVNIRHEDVRKCVHMVMQGVMGMNIYDRHDASNGNGDAYIEYFPLQGTPVTVTNPAVNFVPTAPHGLPAQIPVPPSSLAWLPDDDE